jgi:cystathionine beta-lyase/cystathionine gamma-synthase
MERETLIAGGRVEPVARTTIEPYDEGRPGPFFYQRYAHRVGAEAERLLGELDGGQALLFPSGAGATASLMLATLSPGATVAVADGGYFGTVGLLRGELARWGLEVVVFDQTGPPPPADLVWLEPCSNPMLTFPDLDESIAAAHAAGARVAVDNTVLSPLLLRPLEHGADFVVHSTGCKTTAQSRPCATPASARTPSRPATPTRSARSFRSMWPTAPSRRASSGRCA